MRIRWVIAAISALALALLTLNVDLPTTLRRLRGGPAAVAGALLLPGDRTRRDALVVEGRIAARMIGAVVTLLAIAGTIEGLLSASDAAAAYKYLTSALSALFLLIYAASGWTYLKLETATRDDGIGSSGVRKEAPRYYAGRTTSAQES